MKLFKKSVYLVLILLFGVCSAQLEIPGQSTIFNDNQDQYLDANGISNPIRDGAYNAIHSPDGETIIGGVRGSNTIDRIDDHNTAKDKTLGIVKNIINYALGLLSLVALVYMIYHGFIILTAADDDAKYKEGLKGIKYAAIALIGVGLSWIFVSSIFWLISNVLTKTTTTP